MADTESLISQQAGIVQPRQQVHSIAVYLQCMKIYFSANSMPEAKKVPVFLNLL